MKVRISLIILLLVSLLLSACQTGSTPAPQQTEAPQVTNPAPTVEPVPYPEPGNTDSQPQPPTLEPTAFVPTGSALYPDIADGNDARWVQVQAMALNGEVAKLIVFETTQVTVILKDGRSLRSVVDNLSVPAAMVEGCGEICKEIVIENQ